MLIKLARNRKTPRKPTCIIRTDFHYIESYLVKRLAFTLLCSVLFAAPAISIADEHEAAPSEESSAGVKTEETVADRLKPFGKVCMQGEDCGEAKPVMVTQGGRGALEIYNKHCFACHATGVSEAPLVGAETWQPRLEKGWDVLMENTRNGFNTVMPPMGTCMDCTDEEFRAAIEYMITGEE